MAVQYGEQHGDAVGIKALGEAARRAKAHPIDEPCSSIRSGRPPSRITVTMLPAAGSLERARKIAAGFLTPSAPYRHGEEAELVRRAEAVLGRTDRR